VSATFQSKGKEIKEKALPTGRQVDASDPGRAMVIELGKPFSSSTSERVTHAADQTSWRLLQGTGTTSSLVRSDPA
jgi:hypothetical protein